MSATLWQDYRADKAYDEMINGHGDTRSLCSSLGQYLQTLDAEALKNRRSAAEVAILEMGITFTVYSERGNIDRAWPFGIIPRLISSSQTWKNSPNAPNSARPSKTI